MSVEAVSNEPGDHEKTSIVNDQKYGTDYYRGNYRDLDPYVRVDGASSKSPLVKGNRRTSNPYRRVISRVISDEPAVFHTVARNPSNGVVYGEWTEEHHLSRRYGSIAGLDVLPGMYELSENARRASQTKALNKLNPTTLQLAVDAAEAKKTVNQLADLFKTTLYAIRSIKRGNIGQAIKHMRGNGLSSRWLELQYGIKPLISTLGDAYDLARDYTSGPQLVYGKSSSKWNDQRTVSLGRGLTGTYTARGGAKTYIAASIESQTLRNMNTVGLGNPASIAWELVPFSFVVDWFVPVGDFLEAVSADAGLKYVDGYTSVWTDMILQVKSSESTLDYSDKGGSRKTSSDGNLIMAHKYFRRYAGGVFPDAAVYSKDNPFSTAHVLNALALGTQLFGGRRR